MRWWNPRKAAAEQIARDQCVLNATECLSYKDLQLIVNIVHCVSHEHCKSNIALKTPSGTSAQSYRLHVEIEIELASHEEYCNSRHHIALWFRWNGSNSESPHGNSNKLLSFYRLSPSESIFLFYYSLKTSFEHGHLMLRNEKTWKCYWTQKWENGSVFYSTVSFMAACVHIIYHVCVMKSNSHTQSGTQVFYSQ